MPLHDNNYFWSEGRELRSGKLAKRPSTEPSTTCFKFSWKKTHLKQIWQNVNIVRSRRWVSVFILLVFELLCMYGIIYKINKQIRSFFSKPYPMCSSLKPWRQSWERRYYTGQFSGPSLQAPAFCCAAWDKVSCWADGEKTAWFSLERACSCGWGRDVGQGKGGENQGSKGY